MGLSGPIWKKAEMGIPRMFVWGSGHSAIDFTVQWRKGGDSPHFLLNFSLPLDSTVLFINNIICVLLLNKAVYVAKHK